MGFGASCWKAFWLHFVGRKDFSPDGIFVGGTFDRRRIAAKKYFIDSFLRSTLKQHTCSVKILPQSFPCKQRFIEKVKMVFLFLYNNRMLFRCHATLSNSVFGFEHLFVIVKLKSTINPTKRCSYLTWLNFKKSENSSLFSQYLFCA